jgi:RimJ/RimL family protein N-acetyltransferase
MSFEKIVLTGKKVRLEPLTMGHADGLRRAVMDGELWNLFYTMVPRPEQIKAAIEIANDQHATGQGLAFAVVDIASNTVIGSTRFMHSDLLNKRTEIGATYLAKSFQRTAANTEAKLLMLTHAFEVIGLNRVEFITNYLNTTSRNAILRLGAKEEGIMRSHMVMRDGHVRDSVLFSIIRHEWPGVKQNLLFKLR